MNNETMILLLVVLIAFSAYFSATETAFSTCNHLKLKHNANKGDTRAQLVLDLLEDYDKLISTILVGNNFVNILATTIATGLFLGWFDQNGTTYSTIFMTVTVLIFGEITPKTLGNSYADGFVMKTAPFLYLLEVLLTPITFVFGLWQSLMNMIFKGEEDKGPTSDELLTLVEEVEKEGDLETEESELVRSAIEFNDRDVKDILTPRVDVAAVDRQWSYDQIREMFEENQYSRLPVYEKTIDHIIGFIHEKDFYALHGEYKNDPMSIMKPAVNVPLNFSMMDTLRLLQKNKTHLAIVIDEYGGTEGIVTMEDILEELVGEIWDEHDEIVDDIIKVDDNSYVFTGQCSLMDMFDTFDTYEDDEDNFDSNTVGGWVVELQERFPEKREVLTYKDLKILVLDANDRMVKKVKIIKEVREEPEEDD
ncbi:MAG: HlyC/CorC family transporter [Erysipelotrichaceae bacterium]|nr:HlyC/CorC family transporter [Erysipelotrichaceae bacterium]